jgi:hypothetical protein
MFTTRVFAGVSPPGGLSMAVKFVVAIRNPTQLPDTEEINAAAGNVVAAGPNTVEGYAQDVATRIQFPVTAEADLADGSKLSAAFNPEPPVAVGADGGLNP